MEGVGIKSESIIGVLGVVVEVVELFLIIIVEFLNELVKLLIDFKLIFFEIEKVLV